MKVCEKCHREGAVGRINHEHGGIAWKHEDCQSEHAESVHVDNDLNMDTLPLRQLIFFQTKGEEFKENAKMCKRERENYREAVEHAD